MGIDELIIINGSASEGTQNSFVLVGIVSERPLREAADSWRIDPGKRDCLCCDQLRDYLDPLSPLAAG